MNKKRRRATLVLAVCAGWFPYCSPLSYAAPRADHELLNVAQTDTAAPTRDIASATADPQDFSPLRAGKLHLWVAASPFNTDRIQFILDMFHQDFPQFAIDNTS